MVKPSTLIHGKIYRYSHDDNGETQTFNLKYIKTDSSKLVFMILRESTHKLPSVRYQAFHSGKYYITVGTNLPIIDDTLKIYGGNDDADIIGLTPLDRGGSRSRTRSRKSRRRRNRHHTDGRV